MVEAKDYRLNAFMLNGTLPAVAMQAAFQVAQITNLKQLELNKLLLAAEQKIYHD